ncbi:hypothetical protein VTK26DRAFT_9423 [Humicola hyalothermophila]
MNIMEDVDNDVREEDQASSAPARATTSLLPNFFVKEIFLVLLYKFNDDLHLYAQDHLRWFFNVAQHLACSPDTAISKVICLGLGSMHRVQSEEIKTANSNPKQVEAFRRVISRHLVAVQLGDKEVLERLNNFGGIFAVEINSSVDSALRQLDAQSFIFAPTSAFAIRERALNHETNVIGMLWTDHVYDDMVNDSTDILEGPPRSELKEKYRRCPFTQTCDGLKPEDIGLRLALYFLREGIPDPMAPERDTFARTPEISRITARRATELTASYALLRRTSPSPASPRVICQEFLKVLGRTEVEQPALCSNICACAQFWRYQHYFLPLWDWGIKKIVCFGLGSLGHFRDNGERTYREVIRNPTLLAEFNARKVDGHDALQAMLRHIAAIEIASMVKFCSSKRGVEHQIIKHYFKKLTVVQNMPGSVGEVPEKDIKKLEKLPATAGYAGDKDFVDIPVYFHDVDYTEEDKSVFEKLSEIFEMAHLPPIKMVDAAEQEGYLLIDEHTLIYAVDPDFPLRSIILSGPLKPAAMIWKDHGISPEVGDVLTDEVRPLLSRYEEFRLDRKAAPHTIGSSHMYIRRDIVEAAESHGVVPPYPVTFPHDYPYKHENWYLDRIRGVRGSNRNKCLN